MEAQANVESRTEDPVFDFLTPEYRLTTRGVGSRVSPSVWEGDRVAAAVDELLLGADGDRIVVGCIPFDTSRPAQLYVPDEVAWRQADAAVPPAHKGGTGSPAASSPGLPDSPAYRRAVRKAVERIGHGEVDKVVLARTTTVTADSDFDLDRMFGELGDANPHAFTYRSDLASSGTLIGASPELVLRSRRGAVTSFPLAGSVPREQGNPAQDRELTRGLLDSPKDRSEHALVVNQVGEVFSRHAEQVTVPDEPSVVSTPVILHLGSRITGRLHQGSSPGDLMRMLYDLHPTPAVCGWPTDAARDVIGDLEDFDRGMYSGLVGWVDGDGNGEWALSLRGGVVDGDSARLFAGAGIVAGSDPDKEHEETATKFRTFARVLQNQRQLPVSV